MRSHVDVHRRFENEVMRLRRVAAAAGTFQHLAYTHTGQVIWYVLYMAAAASLSCFTTSGSRRRAASLPAALPPPSSPPGNYCVCE